MKVEARALPLGDLELNLALPLSSWERLGNLLNLFESQFTCLANESNNLPPGYFEDYMT